MPFKGDMNKELLSTDMRERQRIIKKKQKQNTGEIELLDGYSICKPCFKTYTMDITYTKNKL